MAESFSFAETGSGEHYEEAGMSGVRTYLQHAIDQIVESDVEEQQKKGSLYLLNLKEVHGLSDSCSSCGKRNPKGV